MEKPNFAFLEAELKKEIDANRAAREAHKAEIDRAMERIEKAHGKLRLHVEAYAASVGEGRALGLRADGLRRERLANP